MILTFIVINILNLFYDSIGKDIKAGFLVDKKNILKRHFLFKCYKAVRNKDTQAIEIIRKFFIYLGLSSFLLYVLLSKHPSNHQFIHIYAFELLIYIFVLMFGFRENLAFKKELKDIIEQLFKLSFKVLIIYNALIFVIYPLYHSYYTFGLFIIKANLMFIALWTIINLVLLVIYRIFPQLLSKTLVISSNFVINRILKYDRKDPISGLFRYFNYLAGFATIIQFIYSWVFVA